MTPVVKWLLIANIAIFLPGVLSLHVAGFLMTWFAVDPSSLLRRLAAVAIGHVPVPPRHGPPWHIFFNMLVLCFFGPPLERYMGQPPVPAVLPDVRCGGRTLLTSADRGGISCAAAGGASGSILGVMAACAILFPHFVIFLFIVPVPIRVGAIVFAVMFFVTLITRGANAGGEAAHFAGMAIGAAYVLLSAEVGSIHDENAVRLLGEEARGRPPAADRSGSHSGEGASLRPAQPDPPREANPQTRHAGRSQPTSVLILTRKGPIGMHSLSDSLPRRSGFLQS